MGSRRQPDTPGLVSYQMFFHRPNQMTGAIMELLKHLIVSYKPDDCDEDTLIVDSMPIMTCCGRNRQCKAAREIVDKGYWSTKNQYYYGLKLHLVGYRRKGHLPFPSQIVLSSASENDLSVFKYECVPAIAGKTILPTRFIVTIRTGTIREKSKTMNSSFQSRLLKV